ncbi:MAG TPA: phage portal protein [Roseomonas sp.]|nr:phage portal protein [Roseomonas sp.]
MAGLLSRLFRKPETRALDAESFGRFFGIATPPGGQSISPRLAENLATVSACIGAVSSVMASLPVFVYRRAPRGRVELVDHPVARLTRRPNDRQTWPDFIEWLVGQTLLHGNGLAEVAYDGAGRPTALIPVPWPSVQVVVLPSGRLAYDVSDERGTRRRLLDGEVLHVRDRSDDGIVGRSRISRAPEVLGIAIAANNAVSKLYGTGLRASGHIVTPHYLNGTQREQARVVAEAFRQAQQEGRLPVLEGDWKYEGTTISPEDAELLQSRRFSVEELCRLFQVPPPIIQDLSHGTFTNSREAGRWFAQFSLAPMARKIEAEFERSVFGSSSADCMLELDMSGLMRADAEARWQSHKIAVEANILDPDEIREIEGWNPRGQGVAV